MIEWLWEKRKIHYYDRLECWVLHKEPLRPFKDPRTQQAIQLLRDGPWLLPKLLKRVGAVSPMQLSVNDLVNQAELYEEALKYYANILTLYSDKVTKKIDEILALNLPVDMIAPSHGVIWRKDPLQIVKQYQEWAKQKPAPTALIVYDTMWNATEKMAKGIAEGLIECGVDCKVCHAALSDGNDLMVDIFKSKLIVLGSCTHNNGILPSMAKILEEMKGLRFKNKIGAAFGSYGWSGESVKDIEEVFKKAGIPLARPGLKVKWQPGSAEMEQCRAMGRELAAAVKAP